MTPIHFILNPEQNNKYLNQSSPHSFLSEAKRLLESSGSLSEAALMLEAAIQLGEFGEGGFEAWILLGETRNMDEREEAGMRALLEGVKIAEQAGAHGAGMLVSRSRSFSVHSIFQATLISSLWLFLSPTSLTIGHRTPR
jgi:peroxin-5